MLLATKHKLFGAADRLFEQKTAAFRLKRKNMAKKFIDIMDTTFRD